MVSSQTLLIKINNSSLYIVVCMLAVKILHMKCKSNCNAKLLSILLNMNHPLHSVNNVLLPQINIFLIDIKYVHSTMPCSLALCIHMVFYQLPNIIWLFNLKCSHIGCWKEVNLQLHLQLRQHILCVRTRKVSLISDIYNSGKHFFNMNLLNKVILLRKKRFQPDFHNTY